jgi:catechol-2,3-dioxygenase
MVDFYVDVVGMCVNFQDAHGAWLCNDAANHRVALLAVPGLQIDSEKFVHNGIHHLAFEFQAIESLLDRYQDLKSTGTTPHACINHGVTLSFYYEDPDGNSIELQSDNFGGDWDASGEWMRTAPEFRANPIGVNVDPDALVAAWKNGADSSELHRRSYSGEFDPGTPLDLHLPMPDQESSG